MRRLAISMQKGGVGKTTLAINLSGALTHRGHKVLLMDIDPQGYATKAVGFEDRYLADTTSQYNVLTDLEKLGQGEELVVANSEFDLMPAHINMFKLEKELYFESRTEERLKMMLDKMDNRYDFVILDSPPHLGPLNDNALLAAKNVLFPVQSRSASKDALQILFDQIDSLELGFETEITPVGVVVNQTRHDGMSDQMMDWYIQEFGEGNVFEIPFRVALQYAWEQGQTVFEYDGKDTTDLERIFNRIAHHVEEGL